MLSQSLLVFKCQVAEKFFNDFRLSHPFRVEGRIHQFERFSETRVGALEPVGSSGRCSFKVCEFWWFFSVSSDVKEKRKKKKKEDMVWRGMRPAKPIILTENIKVNIIYFTQKVGLFLLGRKARMSI